MIATCWIIIAMHFYSVYGLTIASVVPFKTPLFPAESTTFDLELIMTKEQLWTPDEWEAAIPIAYATSVAMGLRKSSHSYFFRQSAQSTESKPGHFWSEWEITGKQIRCRVRRRWSIIGLENLLLEVILPKYLQLEGWSLFHAAVIEIDGHAVLLSAPTGTGKSTLTMYLSQFGCRFMADDLAVVREVENTYMVSAAYPKGRLHADSLEQLGVPSSQKDRKHIVEINDWAAYRSTSAQLGAIYILQRAAPDANIQINPLLGQRGLTRLIFDMQNDTPFPLPDVQTQYRDATFLSGLMQTIPAILLTFPSDYARLGEVADSLMHDFRTRCMKKSNAG
jgi:hypothetical protein